MTGIARAIPLAAGLALAAGLLAGCAGQFIGPGESLPAVPAEDSPSDLPDINSLLPEQATIRVTESDADFSSCWNDPSVDIVTDVTGADAPGKVATLIKGTSDGDLQRVFECVLAIDPNALVDEKPARHP